MQFFANFLSLEDVIMDARCWQFYKHLGMMLFSCLPMTIEAMFGCGGGFHYPPPYLAPHGKVFHIKYLPVTAAVLIVPGLTPIHAQLVGIGPVPGPAIGPVIWPQQGPPSIFGKPGWCPAPDRIRGSCHRCVNDYSCPGKQKCCTTSTLAPCCTAVK